MEKKLWETELLDYHHSEIENNNEDQRKRKLHRNHIFHYISKHIGKGERYRIKWLHVVIKNNQIIDTYVKWEQIEDKISKYNVKHLKKAYKSIIYKDKIYKH